MKRDTFFFRLHEGILLSLRSLTIRMQYYQLTHNRSSVNTHLFPKSNCFGRMTGNSGTIDSCLSAIEVRIEMILLAHSECNKRPALANLICS